MAQKKAILSNDKGQSAIEFILTIAFALGVTFLFVNQALNLTAGYLAHYVNFKAARAYLVYETGSDNNEVNTNSSALAAEQIFAKSQLKAFGVDGIFKVVRRAEGSALFSGTVLEFQMSISSLPIVGGSNKILFYSESLLGKEPSRATCIKMICAAMTASTSECAGSTGNMDIVLYDNGC